jgi:NADH:ubiquinone oxidoreductase subunit
MIKLCGLWENKDKNGDVYFQGKLGYGARLVIFKNTYATGEKSPGWILYIAEDKKQEKPGRSAWQAGDYVGKSPSEAGEAKAANVADGLEGEGEEEVPF